LHDGANLSHCSISIDFAGSSERRWLTLEDVCCYKQHRAERAKLNGW